MFGNKIIESLRIGFLTVVGKLALSRISALPPYTTALLTATQAVGSTSTPLCFGRVQCKNTTGGILGTLPVTINNTSMTANSVILINTERDSTSAAGILYVANVTINSRVAGKSFGIDLQRKTTGSVGANEGCTINYIILN